MKNTKLQEITFINDVTLVLKANGQKSHFFKDFGSLQEFLVYCNKTFPSETLTHLVFIERLLYAFTGAKYGEYTPENVITHTRTILDHLAIARVRGFVSFSDLLSNDLYNIIREGIFSRALKELNNPDSEKGYNLFELEHLTNLIYLHLLKDISLTIHRFQMSGGDIITENEKDEVFFSLDVLRKELLTMLTPGLRSVITMNRVLFERVFFTGFDTEYQTKELGVNELLCVTTSHFARAVVKIKTLHIDFSVTNKISKPGDGQLEPSTAPDIKLLIYLIRYLNQHEDFALDKLQNALSSGTNCELLEVRRDSSGVIVSLPDKS